MFDIGKDGKPRNSFSHMEVLDEGSNAGIFQRIEVTDEPDDPYSSSIYLTPTKFSNLIRKRLGEKMSSRPKELAVSGSENPGVLGQLFGNKRLEDAEKLQSGVENISIREEIIEEYFRGNFQGYSKEAGDSHFVITENPDSELVKASEKLGVETHVVKMDKSWDSASVNPLGNFRDEKGKRPMLVSVDSPSFTGVKRPGLPSEPIHKAITQAGLYTEAGNPLFSFIEWQTKDGDSSVSRLHPGWYLMRGEDPETAKGLLVKVGIDYLLTSTVRETANFLK